MDDGSERDAGPRPLTPVLIVCLLAPVILLGSFFAASTARSERELAEVVRERRLELAGEPADSAEVDRLISSELAALERAQAYELTSTAMVVVAFGIAVSGLAVAERRRRRQTDAAADSAADQLTGVGDAHLLAGRGSALLSDRRYTHHAVAVVTVPDLHTVAEVYGAGQADRVQIDLARRLRSAVDWLVGERSDATSTIARVADGEFVVMLHARETIDPASVTSVLSLHSGRVIRFGRDRIPVRHMVGVHVAAFGDELVESVRLARDAIGSPIHDMVEPSPKQSGPLSFTR